jgi:hypothetical protein
VKLCEAVVVLRGAVVVLCNSVRGTYEAFRQYGGEENQAGLARNVGIRFVVVRCDIRLGRRGGMKEER